MKVDTLPDVETMTSNVLKVLERATEEDWTAGAVWYPRAHAWCSDLAARYGLRTHTVAGVLAAMSPRVPWQRNLDVAESIIDAWVHGRPVPPVGLLSNVAKSLRILSGELPLRVLGGLKVRSFFRNIMGARSHFVTVDTWAARAAGFGRESFTPKQYGEIAAAYQRAADTLGLAAADLQAVAWTVVRGSAI